MYPKSLKNHLFHLNLKHLGLLDYLEHLELLFHLMYPKSLTNHLFHLNLKHLGYPEHLVLLEPLWLHLFLNYLMFLNYLIYLKNHYFH
jgi:hypothetical protein